MNFFDYVFGLNKREINLGQEMTKPRIATAEYCGKTQARFKFSGLFRRVTEDQP
jgi:hypothetical protein